MKAILIPVTESLKYPRLKFFYYDGQDFTSHPGMLINDGWVWKDVRNLLFIGVTQETLQNFKTNIFIQDRTQVWVCDTEYYKYSCKLGDIL